MIGDLTIASTPEPPRNPAQGTGVRVPASTPVATAPGEGAPADSEQLEASRIKALLTDPGVRVSTHRDDRSGHVVMTVQDRHTGQVVEQFPSDKLLRLYASIRETLVDEQA